MTKSFITIALASFIVAVVNGALMLAHVDGPLNAEALEWWAAAVFAGSPSVVAGLAVRTAG